MSTVTAAGGGSIRSLVPARMDRLPWSRFHWMVVVGLGVSWVLDGLEIQIVASIGTVLQDRGTLHLTAAQVGLLGSVYLAGMGIGGEYAAINSAIDELIPAHYRGRVDIAVNGTYWFGAMIGAGASILLLDPDLLPVDLGWRIGLFIGPVLGLVIVVLRRHIPESPRWLMTHGRQEEAEATVEAIERGIEARGVALPQVPESRALVIRPTRSVSYRRIAGVMLHRFPGRSFLGFSMMVTQAFLYNAIFFTYALVLDHFYGIAPEHIGLFFFPFALGNLLGPLLLGPFFDTVGRRKMIFGTYALSGTLLLVSAVLFHEGLLTAVTQTVFWSVIFFFASAAASSAYLTVSEIFPLELRAQAISFFFAISMLAGGVVAPWLFGTLIGEGTDRGPLTLGYVIGAAVMVFGGLVAWFFGVDAERRALEDITDPLSLVGPPEPSVTGP